MVGWGVHDEPRALLAAKLKIKTSKRRVRNEKAAGNIASGLPGQNCCEIQKAPCPGAVKNVTQAAHIVESKMRFQPTKQPRRCNRDTRGAHQDR